MDAWGGLQDQIPHTYGTGAARKKKNLFSSIRGRGKPSRMPKKRGRKAILPTGTMDVHQNIDKSFSFYIRKKIPPMLTEKKEG